MRARAAEVPGRGGVVFISSPGFFLHALDADTGEPLEDWGEAVPIDGFGASGSVDMVADLIDGWGPWENWTEPYDPYMGIPLEQALEMYKLDVGRFPTTDQGLVALMKKPSNTSGWNGPYLKSNVPQDPWKADYHYKYPGEHGDLDIFTYGLDGTPGGEGEDSDVGNWN